MKELRTRKYCDVVIDRGNGETVTVHGVVISRGKTRRPDGDVLECDVMIRLYGSPISTIVEFGDAVSLLENSE